MAGMKHDAEAQPRVRHVKSPAACAGHCGLQDVEEDICGHHGAMDEEEGGKLLDLAESGSSGSKGFWK